MRTPNYPGKVVVFRQVSYLRPFALISRYMAFTSPKISPRTLKAGTSVVRGGDTQQPLEGHYSPMACMHTSRRDRGPSNSTRKMLCHVPLTSCPSTIGNIRECPRNAAAKCESALSSIALWAYREELGKSDSIFAKISLINPFSCSLAIMAAVACGTLMMQVPSRTSEFSMKLNTCDVMSISCLRSVVARVRSLLTATI